MSMTAEAARQMFGCTMEELTAAMAQSHQTNRSRSMFAMSTLSDCQEQVERGLAEQARQGINRAKWALMEEADRARRLESALSAAADALDALAGAPRPADPTRFAWQAALDARAAAAF